MIHDELDDIFEPDSPYNNGARPAFFIGGPLDGQKFDVGQTDKTQVALEQPELGRDSSPALLPQVRTYNRWAITPQGVAIFIVEPLPEAEPEPYVTHLTVRVVTAGEPNKPKMKRELQLLLDREALPEVQEQTVTLDYD